MQKITSEQLKSKAIALLNEGKVASVLGWSYGDFAYDVTPKLFKSQEEIEKGLIYTDFCGANLSKYLVSKKTDGGVLVFLKPCDTYSFNQLLSEHRFERENVYAVAIPCNGMVDINKVKNQVKGAILSFEEKEEGLFVKTIYNENLLLPYESILLEKCMSCKSKKHVAYDELMGESGDILESNRFDEVARLEGLSPEERFEFWQNELSRCIRCNACRDACPACTCEKCVFDNPSSGLENKAPVNSFEEQMFHIIRALHVAGRCTDCGECSRACPQGIPLHLINRKLIKDMNRLYGEYQAGENVGELGPLVNYTVNDPEPNEAIQRRDNNA